MAEIRISFVGASLSVPGMKIYSNDITLQCLKGMNSPANFQITPLDSAKASQIPYYRLRILTPTEVRLTANVKSSRKKRGEGQSLRLKWDREQGAMKPLRVESDGLDSVKLKAEKFQLYVRNCRIRFGDLEKEVGNDAETIDCEIPYLAEPITITLGDEKKEGIFHLQLKEKPQAVLASFELLPGIVKGLTLKDIKAGKLSVENEKIVNLEDECIRNPKLETVGLVKEIREFCLKPDGFHLFVVGKTRSIKVNDEEKISNCRRDWERYQIWDWWYLRKAREDIGIPNVSCLKT